MTSAGRVLCVCAFLCLAAPSVAAAQSSSNLEIGGHASMLRLGDLDTNAGFGARVTVDLTNWLAIEGEANIFPSERFTLAMGNPPGGAARLAYHRRRMDALAGAVRLPILTIARSRRD